MSALGRKRTLAILVTYARSRNANASLTACFVTSVGISYADPLAMTETSTVWGTALLSFRALFELLTRRFAFGVATLGGSIVPAHPLDPLVALLRLQRHGRDRAGF